MIKNKVAIHAKQFSDSKESLHNTLHTVHIFALYND